MKKLFCIILCLALLAALCACGAKPAQDEATSQSVPEDAGQSEPAPTPEPEPEPEPQSSDDSSSGEAPMPDVFDVPAEDGSVYVKDGLKLVVPNEYANLVLIGQDSPLFGRDDLFSAREIASMEAGEKQHPGEDWCDGALFGIGRLSESEVHEMMCGYLNNEHIFAKDAENNYYVCFQPTDVRFVREDMSNLHDSPDLAQWTALNEWADTVPDSFTELNGLERVYYGGTDAEMMLSRIAYHTDTAPSASRSPRARSTPISRTPTASCTPAPSARSAIRSWPTASRSASSRPTARRRSPAPRATSS